MAINSENEEAAADRDALADAWDAGYTAARRYAVERQEEQRVLARLGLTGLGSGGRIPDPPENPYRDRPDWDF
jgi:hypothetical protein